MLLCLDDEKRRAASLECRIQEFGAYISYIMLNEKFLILYAHYCRVTQSLMESQKINALFSDKQLTQIPAWINLLLPLTAQPAVEPLRAKEKI